ncbi:MAG: hypothetical protein IEMM0008_1890 [bacterium]|nr:MAG: hypothetical protein IEMM0008_1890 [bacterium]
MPKITIINLNKTIDYNPAISLLNNFHILQIPINSRCGGRGNCGTCRFQVLEGRKFITPLDTMERFRLTEDEIAQGWRLSCQSHALRDLKIIIPDPMDENTE